MSIYTRRGDKGMTSLANGARVSKASERVEAYGAIDEANSLIGLARAAVVDERLDSVLLFAQQRLFNCSSSIATPAEGQGGRTPRVHDADISALERAIDRFDERTGALTHFVLESGGEAACRLHVARAATRRAERRLVALAEHEEVDDLTRAFVNRLSDLLFAAARYSNALEGIREDAWDAEAPAPLG